MRDRPSAIKLTPRTRVRRAARLVLAERIADTWKRLPRARAGEPEEGIHQMRIAAKRLREAMRLFRDVYPKREWRPAIERVDLLNDSLGAVRDADVMVEHLAELAAAGPALAAALSAEVATARVLHQAALVETLDRLEADGYRAALEGVVVTARRDRDHEVAGQSLRRFAERCIGLRLGRVLERLREVQGEEDEAGLHQVRVANKNLRYAIEPFLCIFDRRLHTGFRRVVELHGALGDLHDWDVMDARIKAFAAERGMNAEGETLCDRIAEMRAREFGRVAVFCTKDGQLIYGRMIADALE